MLMTEANFKTIIGEEKVALLDQLVELNAILPLNPGLGNFYSTKHQVLLNKVQEVMSQHELSVEDIVPFIVIDGARVEYLDTNAFEEFLNGSESTEETPVTEEVVVEDTPVEEVVETPATEEVVVEDTPVEEVVETPATEEVVVENTPVEEVVETPATEEVVVENTPIEEVVETPTTEEVVVENTTTETVDTPVGLPVLSAEEIANTSYTQLVALASANRQFLPNFRRMKKADLTIAFSGNAQEIEEMIERVRIETRNRYGSGSRNMETEEFVVSDTNDLVSAVVTEEVGGNANLDGSDNAGFEQITLDMIEGSAAEMANVETVVEASPENVEDETVSVESTESEVASPSRVRNRGRAVRDSLRLDFSQIANIDLDEVIEFNYEPFVGTSPEGVNLTLEEIMAKTSKEIAVIVGQARPRVRYFRRMTRDELLNVLFNEDSIMEMMLRAFLRYQRY